MKKLKHLEEQMQFMLAGVRSGEVGTTEGVLIPTLKMFGDWIRDELDDGLPMADRVLNFVELTDCIMQYQDGDMTQEEYDDYIAENVNYIDM